MAAISALAALTALSLQTSPSVLEQSKTAALPQVPGLELPKGEKAPTQKAVQHLFNYLSKESYTPSNEKQYLASQLGVNVDKKDQLWTLPKGQVGKIQPNPSPYNVPYFSTYLLPQEHFTRGGMHAAAKHLEDVRASQGLSDDNGEYLTKKEGQQLSQELVRTIDDLFDKQVAEMSTRPYEGKPISRVQDLSLAKQLEAGESYALLPNHGMKPHFRQAPVVGKAAGKKLAQELLAGQAEALDPPAAPAPRAYPALSTSADMKLAESLERTQAWAQLPNHGKPMVRHPMEMTAADRAEDQKLRQMIAADQKSFAQHKKELAQHPKPVKNNMTPAERNEDQMLRRMIAADKETFALHKRELAKRAAAQAAAHAAKAATKNTDLKLDKYLQQGLKELYPPEKVREAWEGKPVVALTPHQDANLASYLDKGINKIWPEPKRKVEHFLSKEGGERLASRGRQLEVQEFAKDQLPQPKFLSKEAGPQLAREMEQSLRREEAAQGPYVKHYMARMRGDEQAHTRAHPFSEMGLSPKQVQAKKLSETLQQGIAYYTQMKHLAKGNKYHGPKMLSGNQGRALARYLTPQKHIGRNQAPALGFAV